MKFFKLYRCVYNITIRKILCLILSFFFFNLYPPFKILLDCPNSKLMFISLNITQIFFLPKETFNSILYITIHKVHAFGSREARGHQRLNLASLRLSKCFTTELELHPKSFKKKDVNTWLQTHNPSALLPIQLEKYFLVPPHQLCTRFISQISKTLTTNIHTQGQMHM